MNMSEPLRVKTDARYKNVYSDLKNLAIGDFHELFSICAYIGHKRSNVTALSGNKEQKFWSDTFSEHEWACFRAICLSDKRIEYSDVRDERKILSSIEEYANGGMAILISDFLNEFLIEKDGLFYLQESSAGDLPKRFLSYIHDSID